MFWYMMAVTVFSIHGLSSGVGSRWSRPGVCYGMMTRCFICLMVSRRSVVIRARVNTRSLLSCDLRWNGSLNFDTCDTWLACVEMTRDYPLRWWWCWCEGPLSINHIQVIVLLSELVAIVFVSEGWARYICNLDNLIFLCSFTQL